MPVTQQIPVVTYTANGSVTDFAYPYRVLEQTDLFVYEDGVQVTTGFTVSGIDNPSGGMVAFTVAPAAGKVIRIQRSTSIDRDTDYVEGGQLAATVLDNDFDRIVMMLQDINQGPLRETPDGKIDAGNKVIKNVADPVNPTDATNKQYVDAYGVAQVAAAQASANAAATSETNAANSATAASGSATNAATSSTNALTYLNNIRSLYYGALSSDPTLDPLGGAMTIGDIYFNTSSLKMKVYTGSLWIDVAPVLSGPAVSTVSANGTTQGAATGLVAPINVVSTATAGVNDGVILPAASAGTESTIINTSGANIKVYPATGAQIEAGAANASITLATGTRLKLIATSSSQWFAMTGVYA